jgi:hypothetical protein
MALYLVISRGPRADLAEPVLASSDPHIIQAVLAAIGKLADGRPESGMQSGRVVRFGDLRDDRR